MIKCKRCKFNKYRLKCLECEQKAERRHKLIKPEIITPLKKIPLSHLSDKEKVIVLASIVGELSVRRLSIVLGLSRNTVTSYCKRGLKKLKSIGLFLN